MFGQLPIDSDRLRCPTTAQPFGLLDINSDLRRFRGFRGYVLVGQLGDDPASRAPRALSLSRIPPLFYYHGIYQRPWDQRFASRACDNKLSSSKHDL